MNIPVLYLQVLQHGAAALGAGLPDTVGYMSKAGIDWSANDGRNGLMQTTLGIA